MREANFTVSSMHGDMPQKERESIMKEFRSGARWVSCALCPGPGAGAAGQRSRVVPSSPLQLSSGRSAWGGWGGVMD